MKMKILNIIITTKSKYDKALEEAYKRGIKDGTTLLNAGKSKRHSGKVDLGGNKLRLN